MISERIVVVDDDPRVVKSLRLGFPEYEFIDFDNGEDALTYLKKPNTINLVLLDVMMAKIDGLTVLSRIRESKKDIAVVIMTAYGSNDIVIQALRSQANDYIEKPFTIQEMKERISAILKARSYQQNLRSDKDDQVNRIKRYIKRNYENVNLKFIAEELCLSPRYVSRLFNKKSKIKFRAYKLKVKMDRAQELLTRTRLTISEIAIQLGYQNPETFMRMFKRLMKLTPTQYRQKSSKK
jgi:YesN/AraC family two-component response regulator